MDYMFVCFLKKGKSLNCFVSAVLFILFIDQKIFKQQKFIQSDLETGTLTFQLSKKQLSKYMKSVCLCVHFNQVLWKVKFTHLFIIKICSEFSHYYFKVTITPNVQKTESQLLLKCSLIILNEKTQLKLNIFQQLKTKLNKKIHPNLN